MLGSAVCTLLPVVPFLSRMHARAHTHAHARTHTHTEYAEWYVKGMESHPDDPSHVMASACCKHYVANSMDGTTEQDGEHHDRNHYDANITQQDLIDSCVIHHPLL